MKKVVLFFAVVSAFAFASCTEPAPKVEEAAQTVDSLAAEFVDSATAVVDSAAAVVDSAATAVVDSAAAAVAAVVE